MKIALIIFLFIIGYLISMFRMLYIVLVKTNDKPAPIIKNKRVRYLLMIAVNVIIIAVLIYLLTHI